MSARSPKRLYEVPSKFGSAKVKLGIRNTTDTEFAGIVRTSVEQMEGNPNYPDPMPPQDVLAEALNDFNAALLEAEAARSALRGATLKKDALRATLEKLYGIRGCYVSMACGGDATLIYSSGLRVRREPSPIGALDVPSGLYCELNGCEGVMVLTWDAVKNAQTYLVQMAAITPEMEAEDYPWVSLNPSSIRKLTISDLTLGQRYAFRIAAVGGKTGQSPWSPPVMRTAG